MYNNIERLTGITIRYLHRFASIYVYVRTIVFEMNFSLL